jgi:hypothetical protein
MVDFGIVKPELAGSFGAGMQASQENRMRTEEAQLKLDQLKQDREAMLQFQQQLKAAGKDPDLNKLFDAMIATGHPDYAMKGVEGKRRLKAQEEFAKLQGPDMGSAPETAPVAAAAAAPVQSVMRAAPAPASMNALGSGTYGMGAEPTNALAAQAAAPVAATPAPAPVNALAAQPNAGQVPQIQKRINDLMRFASSNPEMATQAMQQARILQDQLELFSRRGQNEPADAVMMQRLGYPLTPQGYADYANAKKPSTLRSPEEEAQAIRIARESRPPVQPVAPTLATIADPNNPSKTIVVDARSYRGGGAGSPGVIGVGGKDEKTTVSEQQASYNIGRILTAAKSINAVAKKDPSAIQPSMGEAAATSAGMTGTANAARSANRQIVNGAQRDALDAMLYLATGAAYNKEQLQGQMEAYIPQYTDKPEQVANKQLLMKDLIQSAKVRAGKAWTPEMETAIQSLVNPTSAAPAAVSVKPPPSVDAALWNVMTPQERALWKK